MTETIEEMEIHAKKLLDEAGSQQGLINDLETQKQEIMKERNRKTAPLYDEIRQIEEPYGIQYNEMTQQQQKMNVEKCSLETRAKKIRFEIELSKSVSAAEYGSESFSALLRTISTNGMIGCVEKQEKKLPNGLTLIRHQQSAFSKDSEWVAYYALRGKQIVGYHHTKKARHRGDYARSTSFIGNEEINERSSAYSSYRDGMTLTQWKERIGSMDINALVITDLTVHKPRELR